MVRISANFLAALRGNLIIRYSFSEETRLNWGDALNRYLIPRISSRDVVHFREVSNLGWPRTYSVIGSVLDNSSTRGLHVWGSGFKSEDAMMRVLPTKVHAVRGPLTRRKLTAMGCAVPDVYGDPALLVSRYVPPSENKKYRLGVIPHYVDQRLEVVQNLISDEVLFINVNQPIETFVEQVTSCEAIASTSLHGLIAADAYSVPSVWILASDRIVGGDFKFLDYFGGVGIEKIPVRLGVSVGVEQLVNRAVFKELTFDADRLLETCPFKR